MNHLHNESEAVRRPAVSAFQRPLHLLQGGQYTLQLAVHQARQGTAPLLVEAVVVQRFTFYLNKICSF